MKLNRTSLIVSGIGWIVLTGIQIYLWNFVGNILLLVVGYPFAAVFGANVGWYLNEIKK